MPLAVEIWFTVSNLDWLVSKLVWGYCDLCDLQHSSGSRACCGIVTVVQLSKLGSAQADQNVDVEQSYEMAGTCLVCEDVRALEKQRNSAAIAAADD